MLKLTFVGMDSWDRPVYQDESANLYCDVDPRKNMPPSICTKQNNMSDGEPCDHVFEEVEFFPSRVTW